MASELRWEVLFDTSDNGSTGVSAGAEFRNDSSQLIHIREITYTHECTLYANEETAVVEISKSPVFSASTNNNVFFTFPQTFGMAGSTDGAALDDGGGHLNGGRKYGRGQLTLEPNESLFVNSSKSSGGKVNTRYIIGYHF